MNCKEVFFAEVIQSFLTHYKAQSWCYTCVPDYGALVVVECDGLSIYALVYQSFTDIGDAGHSVYAFGKTEAELKRDQPQIFALLKTTFNAIVIGYKRDEQLSFQCSPIPAKIHAFIRLATADEWLLFTTDFSYVHLLFGQNTQGIVDELLLAFIRYLKERDLIGQQPLIELLYVYAQLVGNDYHRMRFFAHGLERL